MTIETWKEQQKKWKIFLINADISQKDFAERFGFSESQLSQWFNGKQKASANNEGEMHRAFYEVDNIKLNVKALETET